LSHAAIAIPTGMTCNEAAFLQGRYMPKQRGPVHLAFVCQPLCAWVALAGFLVVEIRQLDQHNLGGRL
jgi:tryptophan-rich sensory protein